MRTALDASEGWGVYIFLYLTSRGVLIKPDKAALKVVWASVHGRVLRADAYI